MSALWFVHLFSMQTRQWHPFSPAAWQNGSLWYLDDLQHLHSCDLAVSIQVVHVEGPVELLLEAASWCDGQRADELSEVDGAVAVLVEGPEGVLCELGGIAVREELEGKTRKQVGWLVFVVPLKMNPLCN